jgi:hypothetical protein
MAGIVGEPKLGDGQHSIDRHSLPGCYIALNVVLGPFFRPAPGRFIHKTCAVKFSDDRRELFERMVVVGRVDLSNSSYDHRTSQCCVLVRG